MGNADVRGSCVGNALTKMRYSTTKHNTRSRSNPAGRVTEAAPTQECPTILLAETGGIKKPGAGRTVDKTTRTGRPWSRDDRGDRKNKAQGSRTKTSLKPAGKGRGTPNEAEPKCRKNSNAAGTKHGAAAAAGGSKICCTQN